MANNSEQDESQKTEEPTPKKIQKARQEGQVPISREINTWIMLFVVTIFIVSPAALIAEDLMIYLTTFFEKAGTIDVSPKSLELIAKDLLGFLALTIALPLAGLSIIMIGGVLAQIGPLYAPKKIKPNLKNISPLTGLKRLFSSRSLFEFLKGLFKISIVGFVGIMLMRPEFRRLDALPYFDASRIIPEIIHLLVLMMGGILAFLLAVTIADTFYQRYQHTKSLRMTRQEVRDELKEAEGNPQIKARIRRIRAERARQRMAQSIPQADVVITNPTHYSIALQYQPEYMEAPTVIAKGVDEFALRIREIARAHEVPLVENAPLARALHASCEIDEPIQSEHYQAVAEIISYVWGLKNKVAE